MCETRVVVLKNKNMEGVATERESTLTLIHICHRTRIPIRHALVELRCTSKHYKRGLKPTTATNLPIQKEEKSERVRIDKMKLELTY